MAAGSFSAGLSGLSANQTALSVIGNNLGNLNTVAYKTSTVTFSDLVSQTVGGSSTNPMQIGLGVQTASISPSFSQGPIDSTTSDTDVAIQGEGFFVVEGEDGLCYTRAGSFKLDDEGYLVTSDGYRVQGYTTTDPVTGEIVTSGNLNDIVVPKGVLQTPIATTTFQTLSNLNSDAEVGTKFTASVQIYDPKGSEHVVTITYTKTAGSTWSYDVTVPGDDVTGGTAGTPYSIGTGSMVFGTGGKLSTVNGATAADVSFTTPAWANGAAASTLSWDLVDDAGTAAITSYSAESTTSSKSQNGTAAGSITDIAIATDGTITATLSTGETVDVAKLALASFNNAEGLQKLGSSRYGATQAAGLPSIGGAGEGGRGTLTGSALEGSNVDMATEFTKMILAQRGYQASSKTITVADELLQDTLNLKR